MAKKQATLRKAGRPKGAFKTLDLSDEAIYTLACDNNTVEDIARLAGCSDETIRKRYLKVINRGRAVFRSRIKAAQIKAAESGAPAMLIWLGKQYLSQREAPEQNDEPDNKVQIGSDSGSVVTFDLTMSIDDLRARAQAVGLVPPPPPKPEGTPDADPA